MSKSKLIPGITPGISLIKLKKSAHNKMKSFKTVLFLIGGLLFANLSFAQNGAINGKVIDENSGEPIIGANILVVGTTTGTATDVDGNFKIKIEPGTYDLRFSFVSYATKRVSGVVVKPGETITLNVKMQVRTEELEELVVTARSVQNSESAALLIQRKSPDVVNAISSETFNRTGDSNAGAALKRVPGISVEAGKYIYIRGLGDRYSKSTFNSANVPSLDPNRNAVQMDLYPTDIIDNIVVHKTFRPDLPGDFSGGLVNINTKDYPDEFSMQFSSSFGYNSNANFNSDFLTYEGGNLDFLGFDDGTRGLIPASRIEGIPPRTAQFGTREEREQLAEFTKSLNDGFNPNPVNETKALNQSYSFSLGSQSELFGKEFGYIASISYDRNFESYNDGRTGIYSLTGNINTVDELVADFIYKDDKSTENILWGGLLSSTLRLNNLNKISFSFNRNQSAEKSARFQNGPRPEEADDIFIETRTLNWEERSVNTFQLKGDHAFGDRQQFNLDWNSSYTLSGQEQPDLRFFSNSLEVVGQDTIREINNSFVADPRRFTRDLEEFNIDNQINLELTSTIWNDLKASFKVGGTILVKDREFRENAVEFSKNGNAFAGTPEDHISDLNVIDPSSTSNSEENIFVLDLFQQRNNYDGEQTVWAAFGMTELPISKKFRMVIGARLESTDLDVESFDPNLPPGQIDDLDLLPSVNLNYNLTDKMNLRGAYSRTLARPTFREVAPFTSFSFDTEPGLVGNPNLERTLVDNFDIRWEVFPSPEETFSISAFYKKFQDPIEKSINTQGSENIIFQFRNVDQAELVGVELEFRKKLGFLGDPLENFRLGSNVSLIHSTVDIPEQELISIRANRPNASSTRSMFGQSPFIVNAFLQYQNRKGTEANINFNVQGERITFISKEGTPNVKEQPYPLLDMNIQHQIFPRVRVKASASNLLNAVSEETFHFKGQDFFFSRSQLGRSFSLGVTYNL